MQIESKGGSAPHPIAHAILGAGTGAIVSISGIEAWRMSHGEAMYGEPVIAMIAMLVLSTLLRPASRIIAEDMD